ncbi:hypothetical protein SLEP1_g28714 [Rubroshorea leprosula]|uniref:Transcriptional regulator STERILE APETALA n=1 Tax=Rubroshorea leprosula TaxID=152421 RepID=A0AAV5K102_9ROSI|nr:hypothetical protein SLEP1_g28714 [Rubroshorea leprosula]
MSSSSSASSSAASSSAHGGNGSGNAGTSRGVSGSRRGRGDFEGPSSSRHRRENNEVWPEPVVEALAAHVAIDAFHSLGRLAAAVALANVFQVCSTWRAVSRSDLLWNRLTRIIWGRSQLTRATWRDEYIFRHRTALNFRNGRSLHSTLHFDPSDVDSPVGLFCRCLTLSDLYLACGFADGTVRLFDLHTRLHVSTFRPPPKDHFGQFSRAVSGIIISDARLIFATMDGDVHVAIINGDMHTLPGQVLDDGALVEFTGCSRWWVGLYAGVPGQAFHIWDSNTEELVFVGGTLTDTEAVRGWHMLAEPINPIGRIRVTSQESAVACTSRREIVFDLRNQVPLREEEHRRGLIETSLDVNSEAYVVAESRSGIATVRRVDTLEEICRFGLRQRNVIVMGSMNQGYSLMCAGGVIRVWEVEGGQYLYSFQEQIGDVNAMVADDRHVAAAGMDTTIHLWDFGAED